MKQKNILLNLFILLILVFSTIGIAQAQNKEGSPCITGGTILFKEDFGGNEVSDPNSPLESTLKGYTALPYASGEVIPFGGFYTLIKDYRLNEETHYQAWDHTSLNDPTRGYMMYIDPGAGHENTILYRTGISNLCPGVRVVLSLWAASISKKNPIEDQPQATPKFELQIQDENGVILESVYTQLQNVETQDKWRWEQICIQTTIPIGKDKIQFVAVNREDSIFGNDWFIDDLEVRLITPTVNTSVNGFNTSEIIITDDAQTTRLAGNYIVDNTFGYNLTSAWLYSESGIMEDLSAWKAIDMKKGMSSLGSTWTHNLNLLNTKEGYYRLAIGNSNNVLTTLCRAASGIIHIHK
ncbi:hypothetical protein JGH11_02975 [Dysgonomonas sp. Marseille-P4677]|uniref:hypothetical protein n=1 Tax=Dysgonomonas sp. Marseille-P4677 TaxID=2364790 RepID=UPI00191383C8|nr:hypothetical protein [Dysgonomonas sp. Marseille-P4677]MBK5719830.1 hypothetical protein [Dysgonomonas sp. Marseille-P4677]